jgi:catechol-2,3-dioxygenase
MWIRSVELDTAHPDEIARFYRDTLESEVRRDGDDVVVTLGRSVLRFVAVDDPVPVAHLAINVPPRRFDDTVTWLRERTLLLDDPRDPRFAFPAWDAHSVYSVDPDGNVLEWIARHRLEEALPGRLGPFSGAEQVEVSEVGIAVEDVAEAARALGFLPTFDPGGDRFRAMGDDRGMLILSQRGRPWFPTGIPADPVRMQIETDVRLDVPIRVGEARVEGVGETERPETERPETERPETERPETERPETERP